MTTLGKSIVFLDRDGTINFDDGYVTSPSRLRLIPGAAEAIAAINNCGFAVIIVTNQSAVGRRMATEEDVIKTNSALVQLLQDENPQATIAQVLFATDHPDSASNRRKPGIGMLRDLSPELQNFDRTSSWVVGDKFADIQFGLNAGLPAGQCVLTLTGEGEKELGKIPIEFKDNIRVCNSLHDAAKLITKQ